MQEASYVTVMLQATMKMFEDHLQGMVENRKCRDVLFLLFFIAYWAGMFVVCGIAFQEGKWPRHPYLRELRDINTFLQSTAAATFHRVLLSKAALYASTRTAM